MSLCFRYRESRYYSFGLKMGLRNLLENGFSLGLRKTIGKISQPINSYTRFPEYYYMDLAIQRYLAGFPNGGAPQVLDVGSPKCFGLYLASKLDASLTLTDISHLNLDEYQSMWGCVRHDAIGELTFSVQDARSLEYANASFDIVYSMSVVEHVAGADGDSRSVREMVRVLKPGGLLVLSVPFGGRFATQWRKGFANAVEKRDDSVPYFFQRIYDRPALESRIIQNLCGSNVTSVWTIWRQRRALLQMCARLGENVKGLLGPLNPLFSLWANRSSDRIVDDFAFSYGDLYSDADFYGDVVIVAQKGQTQDAGA